MADLFRVTRALTRRPCDRFPEAVTRAPKAVPIDLALALRQHRAYVEALRGLGLTVTELPPLADHPDCCFVEDCAILAEGVALVGRPGIASRQGEEKSVAQVLAPRFRLDWVLAPATLEGGDCLCVGRRWFVGLSSRTNAAGAGWVRDVFGPLGFEVVEIPVTPFFHLKSVCGSLGDDRVLLAQGTLPRAVFAGLDAIEVPREEAYAANCVRVGDTVLVAAGYPATARALQSAGYRVLPLDVSEIRKADGSLTCLSILS